MLSDEQLVGGGPGKVVFTIVWYSLIIFIALMAVGVELDRQGRGDLTVAMLVPDRFRADSLGILSRYAFERGDTVEGEALARTLVERRPIPAEALSLYAAGLIANGKEDTATGTLQIAASRGWRDRFVQRVVILSSLQQGTLQVAANRVVGLWRLGERSDWLKDLTRATLEAPGGVSAFENALIAHDKYLGTDFLLWAAVNLPVATVEHLANHMANHDSQFDCLRLSSQTESLVTTGNLRSATVLWSAFCRSVGRTSVDYLEFTPVSVAPGPSDWRYPESPNVDVEVVKIHGASVLHYLSTDPLLRTVARRYIALNTGRYTLKLGNDSVSSKVKWHIACVGGGGGAVDVPLAGEIEHEWSFTIPKKCPAQELSITVRSGSSDIASARLSGGE
ncbi:hypothetical protein NRB_05570 [Novosphingobium sp. 11B]